MTLDALMSTLDDSAPPDGLRDELRALWHEARDDWSRAHAIVQGLASREAAWVHAYLHRKEGDLDNARYWYRRASASEATGAFEDEWRAIATALLEV